MKAKVKKRRKYLQIQDYIKKRIQTGKYPVGTYLPSENEICAQFSTTRTTVRRALEELVKEGFVEKEHGKGSRVLERRKSLGLLTVKGFSEVTDYQVKTVVLQEPKIGDWGALISFPLSAAEKNAPCVYFQRVRYLEDRPIVLEHNW
ncbi:MAG: GntR family transcriptional regulator, partial [Flavobacteriaceae bacterium]